MLVRDSIWFETAPILKSVVLMRSNHAVLFESLSGIIHMKLSIVRIGNEFQTIIISNTGELTNSYVAKTKLKTCQTLPSMYDFQYSYLVFPVVKQSNQAR